MLHSTPLRLTGIAEQHNTILLTYYLLILHFFACRSLIKYIEYKYEGRPELSSAEYHFFLKGISGLLDGF